MKTLAAFLIASIVSLPCFAELPSSQPEILPGYRSIDGASDIRARPNLEALKPDTDGEIGTGEYQVISADGSVTRRPCPYTCEMRGLAEGSCRTWQSQVDPALCYVQDTRMPQNAIPLGK